MKLKMRMNLSFLSMRTNGYNIPPYMEWKEESVSLRVDSKGGYPMDYDFPDREFEADDAAIEIDEQLMKEIDEMLQNDSLGG